MGNIIVCVFLAFASGGGFNFGQCLRDRTPSPTCGGNRQVQATIEFTGQPDNPVSLTQFICLSGRAILDSQSSNSFCSEISPTIVQCSSSGDVVHTACCVGDASMSIRAGNIGTEFDTMTATFNPSADATGSFEQSAPSSFCDPPSSDFTIICPDLVGGSAEIPDVVFNF